MPKRRSFEKQNLFGGFLALSVLLAVENGHAAALNPAGSYSDAKIEGAAPSTGTLAVPAQPANSTWAVKQWSKFKNLTSRWMVGAKPADTPVKAPVQVSKPVVAAPAPVVVQPRPPVLAPAPAVVVAPSIAAPVVSSTQMKKSSSGVPIYDLSESPRIPRLAIDKEERIRSSRYGVEGIHRRTLEERIIHRLEAGDLLSQKEMKMLTAVGAPPQKAQSVAAPEFQPKGVVGREGVDRISIAVRNENPLQLRKFTPLTPDEMRFLSGLLLYNQGDKCPMAIGLFHSLSKSQSWQAEADYFSAMCSRKIGLETDFMERARRVLESGDLYYSRRILKEIGYDIPYEFTESFGATLAKAIGNPKVTEGLDEKTLGNIAFLLTKYGSSVGKYKVAQAWARQVPESHPRELQARFLEALAEYQVGSKERALKMQEELITDLKTDKEKAEFQALVALNLGRMYFQERQFKPARESLLKVYKDHPMWLQSLTEMGWSQLMSGDYEGAIGNMYSVQSPYFAAVYKPESYVIRTIGYLNLCQYGDAYKTLSILEHEYRPYLDKINRYLDSSRERGGYYQTVKNFVTNKMAKEIDGLPMQVVREMARHRDFTNMQKAFNRLIDERQIFVKLDQEVNAALGRAESLLAQSQRRVTELRRHLEAPQTGRDVEQNKKLWTSQLNKEFDQLEAHQFQMDLFAEAKKALPSYRKDVAGIVDKRLNVIRTDMDKLLGARLAKMRTDLVRIMDNNELLRYEVFSGSGENIRFQVSGGEKGNRVPASVIPKSKSLQWQFNGEYWEDEIGHYRSSLKNNCPEAAQRGEQQARLDGGEK